MNRSEKSRKSREEIIDASRRLFIRQGYAQTTIRQISEETGLTTGSLYNFFRNKEGIFLRVVTDYLDRVNLYSESITSAGTDPTVKYAIIICLQFIAVDRYREIADLILEAYNSWTTLDAISRNSGIRNRTFFGKYNPHLSDDDYYLRSLAINGAIRNSIAESLHSGKLPADSKLLGILDIAFFLFKVPGRKSVSALRKARELLERENLPLSDLML
jgi:AcrR family transcriptional regulator